MHSRHRLRSRADFSRVTRGGVRTSTPAFALYALVPGAAPVPRVGFSVGRALGKAVVRNRTRRRLREAIAPLLPSLGSCDLVVVARPAAVDQPIDSLVRALEDALTALATRAPVSRGDVGGTMGAREPSPDVTEGTSS